MTMKPDLSLLQGPIGPYRDKYSETIGGADFELATGFTCQAGSAGNITYRTLVGTVDQTETGLTAGDSVAGAGGVPVVLVAVRSSSTVTSIVVSVL